MKWVSYGRLKNSTREAWDGVTEDGPDSYREEISLLEAEKLYAALRTLPDEPRNFPAGKWDSLQFFESLIKEAYGEKLAPERNSGDTGSGD